MSSQLDTLATIIYAIQELDEAVREVERERERERDRDRKRDR